jgi:hypothetical protein
VSPAATTTSPRTRPRPPLRAPQRGAQGARSTARSAARSAAGSAAGSGRTPRRAPAPSGGRTATTRAATATATARARPVEPGSRRPQLRVVESPAQRRRRVLRTRRAVVAGTVVAAVGVFTVVAFHVMLAQGQVGLARLQGQVSTAERDYQEARYAHARAASPERIVSLATKMGLVPADRAPVPVAVPGPLAPSTDASGSGTLGGYAKVKTSLADGP